TEQNEDTRESLVTQLQKQKESTEVSLEERKKDLAAFLQENGSVDPQTAAMVSARYNIRLGELSRLTEERRRLQLASTTAEAFKGDPETLLRMLASDPTTRAAAMDPVSDELRLQARNYDAQLVTLRSEITDKHPAIGELEKRVAELRSELAGRQELFAKNYVASVSQSLAAVKAEEERLAAEVKADEELRQIMSNHVREIDTLDADIRDKRAAIKLLDDRITAINLNKVDKATELKIQIVDDAYVATATVAAGKTTTVAIMGFLGLLFGAALAWLRGMLDHRIRRVEDVTQGAGLQVVGVMPRGTFRKGSTALEAWQTSNGLAEAARSLRTAVYFAMSAGDDHTLHVTSPDPGDGKSLTTASLAIAMAQAGQKTLIIDADLRKPRQDELWGVDNDYGLANMLHEPRARSGVVATDQPGLDLLPAGAIPDNPAELLSS
nr:hypothetical protein [Planctomycetota bacterium]